MSASAAMLCPRFRPRAGRVQAKVDWSDPHPAGTRLALEDDGCAVDGHRSTRNGQSDPPSYVYDAER